jgi:hypothetical protein
MRTLLIALAILIPSMAMAACCGDCDRDGHVRVNELVIAVDNALSQVCAQGCCGDCNGDSRIDIDDLVQSVGNALGGCRAVTPTPTLTPIRRKTPTGTRTPTTVPAGVSALIGPWSYNGTFAEYVINALNAGPPQYASGYENNLPDIILVYRAGDVPGVPKDYQFVWIDRDPLDGVAFLFAANLTGNTLSGVRTSAGYLWPNDESKGDWQHATPNTLIRFSP